jgi:hypothetical protein
MALLVRRARNLALAMVIVTRAYDIIVRTWPCWACGTAHTGRPNFNPNQNNGSLRPIRAYCPGEKVYFIFLEPSLL